jgi:acyl dehydratase
MVIIGPLHALVFEMAEPNFKTAEKGHAMRMVEFFKENQQKARQVHVDLVGRFEPKWRHLSDTMNKKLTDALSSPWGQQYLHFFDAEQQKKEAWLAANPILEQSYQLLSQELGEETFVGEWFTVDQACINQFADATGDKQWIHVDTEKAEAHSPYKSTIAHGFLTLALIPMLTKTIDSQQTAKYNAKMVVNFGLNKVRFPYPVKEGKRVKAHSRLMNIDVINKSTIEVIREINIEIEGIRRPACIAETVIRFYF